LSIPFPAEAQSSALCCAAGDLWRRGGDAGRNRNLRIDSLLRSAANQGDRHPYGAGFVHITGTQPNPPPKHVVGRGRYHRRLRRGGAALTRFLQGLLFGVEPFDGFTLLSVVGLFVFVAAAASYVPARRATRVDPMVVLRSE